MIYLYGDAQLFRYDNTFKYYLNDRFGTNKLMFYPVYQLQPSHLVKPEELSLMAELLGASVDPVAQNGFYLRPPSGQITPWGLKFTQMMQDLRFQTLFSIDRYFYCYIEGHTIDYETQRMLTKMFLPEIYVRESRLTFPNALKNRDKHLDWLHVCDVKEERIQRILNRYGMHDLKGVNEEAFQKFFAHTKKILPLTLLAFSALPIATIRAHMERMHLQKRQDIVINADNGHFHYIDRMSSTYFGSVGGKKSAGICMKQAVYSLYEQTRGGAVDDIGIVFSHHKSKYGTWSHFSHLSGTPVQLIQFSQQKIHPRVFAFGVDFECTAESDLEDAAIVLIGSPKMSRLVLLGDHNARQDDLSVPDSNYLNPELIRRFQAIFFRANQLEGRPIAGVLNITRSGLVPKLMHWVSLEEMGFRLDVNRIPRFHANIRDEDMLYQPWNDALVLIIEKRRLSDMTDVFEREVCPYRVIGSISKQRRVIINGDNNDEPYLDYLISDVVDSDFTIKKVEVEPELLDESEGNDQAADESVSNQLLGWLYNKSFADASLFLERLDVSGYGRSIQGMMVGRWQTPVNQAVVLASGRTWYAKSIVVMDDAYQGDIDLAIRQVCARVLQHIEDFSQINVHLVIPERFHDAEKIAKEIAKYKINITSELVPTNENLLAIGHGCVVRRNRLISPAVDISQGKTLVHVYPSSRQGGFADFYNYVSEGIQEGYILGFSSADMGLWPGLLRILFASRLGFRAHESQANVDFWVKGAEGVICQLSDEGVSDFQARCPEGQVSMVVLGELSVDDVIKLDGFGASLEFKRRHLQKVWARDWLNSLIHRARENDEYFSSDQYLGADFPGLEKQVLPEKLVKYEAVSERPITIAIIRDRGSFGHFGVAKALVALGVRCVDMTFTDLIESRRTLRAFEGLIFPGGATYGDEGNAGLCTAQKILKHEGLRREFEQFFLRPDTLTLGFGNGGQILAHLQTIIPGANWEIPTRNPEDKFVSRYLPVRIQNSPSVVMKRLQGCELLLSYGMRYGCIKKVQDASQVVIKVSNPIVDSANSILHNPVQADQGAMAFTSEDGRVTWFLGHPERHVFLHHYDLEGLYWCEQHAPWMQIFHSMALWIDRNRMNGESEV